MRVGRRSFSRVRSPVPHMYGGEGDGLMGLLRDVGRGGVQRWRTPVGCSVWALPHPPVASRFDDIDLPSAVKYLIASDPNLQVLGAAYLQHKCYSDSNAKKQVSTREPKGKGHGGAPLGGWRRWREPRSPGERLGVSTRPALPSQARSLQAMPKLVKLFNSPNQEVQRHATGAMRNLIYDNVENKLALVEENGIYELMRTLREPDDELRKNVTGWGQRQGWAGVLLPLGGGTRCPHPASWE